MSEGLEKDPQGERDPATLDDDERVRGWIRGAMKDAPDSPVDVLGGVQKKIRERSGGKFYSDFWSTAKAPPTATLLATGAIMLAIVVATYAVLFSMRGHVTKVRMEPAPVDVLPSQR